MKRAMVKWGIIYTFLLFFSSCNIKAPLEEILPEGNATVAPYIVLDGASDTLSIQNYLPQIGSFDSISSNTLTTKSLNNRFGEFIISEKNGKTTIHEIQIWKLGKKSSLIAIRQINTNDSPKVELAMKSFLNNVIFVISNEQPINVKVLWQNTVLPDRFITNDNKGISIFIPKEAKAIHHSTLRIFAQYSKRRTGMLSIDLTDGEPIAQNKISN